MKFPFKTTLFLCVIGGAGAAGYQPAKEYWKKRNQITWETANIESGDITRYVNSTGTIQPVLSVSVGSFVSGPIVELNVDFNDTVTKGDVLARIDPSLFQASVDRDMATLAIRRAELERIEALMDQAETNLARGKRLKSRGKGFMSDTEMEALGFEVRSLAAQRKLAEATIAQAQATLETSQANLTYCEVTAPVDGIVINRLINPGQTLAAQFQTPELFVVAPDLREKVHVFASVDEADMGLIQKANAEQRPVTFTVDAHPDEVFEGTIEQIRVSSTATQNVVTYPVIIAASNPDLKLLPGMTASISFEVDSTFDVPKIPNAALRFFPENAAWVREEDRHWVDGSSWDDPSKDENESDDQTAHAKADSYRKRNQRHVWAISGESLKAIRVVTGLTENRFTEIVEGDLKPGDSLVVGKKD